MRHERKSNNRSAPGGSKATEDLESRKSMNVLKATKDLKSRNALKATEDLESRKDRSELKATEDLENRRSGSELPLPNDDQVEEEVENKPSLPEGELPPPPPPPRETPPEEHRPQKKDQTTARQASIERTKNAKAFPLAMAPPRRSLFATHILAEAIQPGIKIPNLSEYNGVGDPQDHLDQILARADLLDISDAAYCKLFRTTLSGKAMTWFNQLPPGTIETFEQLSWRFLHHFAINKRYPKTASYLFTIVQHEHDGLSEYVQRFSEAVLEVPHVNPELLTSIIQQNLRSNRFKESITGKPPATKEELLAKAAKYIRIEETAGTSTMTPMKRRSTEGGVMPPKAEGAIAKQQGLVRQPPPMQNNPKRMDSDRFCQFYEDRGHNTEDCYNLKDEIERLVQKGYFKEFLAHGGRMNDF
ncbi:UNVERIFIED_CONTAM: hypothetical protein Slati_1921500 [Sesamum latifolium]|uniref:Retrotransposon gag domain-containing protein n=1 Tax=Sesamum latifolium TaxID=2727402 RepID=A0AAW2X304_9LAMI